MEPDVAPLASLSQIQQTPSGRDGIPQDLEEDLRAYGAKMIQQAGILLKQLVSFNKFLNSND
jgi:cyclin L